MTRPRYSIGGLDLAGPAPQRTLADTIDAYKRDVLGTFEPLPREAEIDEWLMLGSDEESFAIATELFGAGTALLRLATGMAVCGVPSEALGAEKFEDMRRRYPERIVRRKREPDPALSFVTTGKAER